MSTEMGETLIRKMLSDPTAFQQRGGSYDLLQQYFAGLSVDTLAPLLRHGDGVVRRQAIWIASELASRASPVIDSVLPLLSDDDYYIASYALETVMSCSIGHNALLFLNVINTLENADVRMRVLAMFLISNASQSLLECALRYCDRLGPQFEIHRDGITNIAYANNDGSQLIAEMLGHPNVLMRRYGAIAAQRCYSSSPGIIRSITKSNDADIAKFAQQMIRQSEAAS